MHLGLASDKDSGVQSQAGARLRDMQKSRWRERDASRKVETGRQRWRQSLLRITGRDTGKLHKREDQK